jgi:hypothetical protein
VTSVEVRLEEVSSSLRAREEGVELAEQAAELSGSLRLFNREAWPLAATGHTLVPTFHIDAISDHVQAAYERLIPRLLITIQPGMTKSSIVSVLAPAWRWTSTPSEQIVSASHVDTLSTRDTRRSRSIIGSTWYQRRWPHVQLLRDENLKMRYSNVAGGWRIATHVGGGTGERGGVLILDDPHNAQDALANTETKLQAARDWIGNTWSSRLNVIADDPGVKIVIGQRVHERDVMGFLLDGDEDAGRWVHLCLPTRYDPTHPFTYPDKVFVRDGDKMRELQGDPRTKEDQLLAPDVVDEKQLAEIQHDMSQRTIEAQYQQRPTPREGAILKRADWRYFDRDYVTDAQLHRLPPMRMIVCSWDTSFKAKVTSDKVAGGAWGISYNERADEHIGADHYLLVGRHERLSLQQTKDAMKDMRSWCVARWPDLPVYVLIEKSANGVEIIEQLERELTGVIAYTASVDKKLRAEAAAPALESHNVYVPGGPLPDYSGPDPSLTDSWVMVGIEQAAKFTGASGDEDDWVDHFTQMINWTRTKDLRPSTVTVPAPDVRVRVGGIIGSNRRHGVSRRSR